MICNIDLWIWGAEPEIIVCSMMNHRTSTLSINIQGQIIIASGHRTQMFAFGRTTIKHTRFPMKLEEINRWAEMSLLVFRVCLFFWVYLVFLGLGRWMSSVPPPVSNPLLGKLDLGGWPEIGLFGFLGLFGFFSLFGFSGSGEVDVFCPPRIHDFLYFPMGNT